MEEIFSLGQWIRRRRRACDLTQAQLAQRVGYSKELIAKIEADSRRPSLHLAGLLADQLGLRAGERDAFLRAARAELAVDRLESPSQHVRGPALPRGNVTLLFAEIAGGPQLWARHPQQMAAVVIRQTSLLRDSVAAAGGAVFKAVGDATFAAFANASAAVAAAAASQRALGAVAWGLSEPLYVRMALWTEELEPHGEDYFGLPIVHANRLLAAAHGGQILLSYGTSALAQLRLPPGMQLRNLGDHYLKDLLRPIPIFQLVCDDLPAEFPPLQTQLAHRNNLPAQSTALIGREREISALARLLRQGARLVTLVGPGGVGKTRLGLQVAAELLGANSDGAWFVNLAPIGDPALIAPTIAQVLGVPIQNGQLQETINAYLCGKQLLLVLDNFEQLLDGAEVVATLLAAAPRLSVLVTSRAPLRIYGEHEYDVPPLALPAPGSQLPPGQLGEYEAVRLFVERAQAVRTNFALAETNASAVLAICARLDGLPLAIELAATYCRQYEPQQLLARLEHRLALLTDGPRDRPARLQTLRGALDWSYHLLEPAQQSLFRRLGVFVGGCDAESAAAMAQDIVESDLFAALERLVGQSMLRRAQAGQELPRFVQLETIREYALEQLEASGETKQLRDRHAGYFLALAEAAAPALLGWQQQAWLARLDAEIDNLRAALSWAIEQDDLALGLRLCVGLTQYWQMRSAGGEACRWFDALLGRGALGAPEPLLLGDALLSAGSFAPSLGESIRFYQASLQIYQDAGDQPRIARALRFLGRSTVWQGDRTGGVAIVDESLARYRALGDASGIAGVLLDRCDITSQWENDYVRAAALAEESLQLFRQVGEPRGIRYALYELGWGVHDLGDLARGIKLVEEGLALARATGDRPAILRGIYYIGMISCRNGDLARARALFEEQLVLGRELGLANDEKGALASLAMVARYAGDLAQARMLIDLATALPLPRMNLFSLSLLRASQATILAEEGELAQAGQLFRECLAVFQKLGPMRWDCAMSIEGLAMVAEKQAHAKRAVQLWASAEAIRMRMGAPLPPIDNRLRAQALARLRAQLGERFDEFWAAGQALALDQAIALALGQDTP